jgi:hypothetical protein
MNDFDNWARWFVLDLSKNLNGEYVSFPTRSASKAWNHQQQKIDAVLKFINGYNSADIDNDVVLRDCISEIQELLK